MFSVRESTKFKGVTTTFINTKYIYIFIKDSNILIFQSFYRTGGLREVWSSLWITYAISKYKCYGVMH